MGLASSQARLLLLTARKSDLEFKAQQITNSEMILAMQTEEVAREYSRKLSNQTLKLIDQANQTELNFKASTLGDLSANSGTPMSLQVWNGSSWETWSDGMADYSGREILAGVNAGTMKIVTTTDEGTKEIDAINGTAFAVAYYTEDDQAADAKYRSETAKIQIKEKRLQMDLQQVETQQKACETEIDSVKKIMDKNIDRTFKVFS